MFNDVCISLIVAMDEENGIGKNNSLLCHLPADLRYFKKMTLGKPIIMGRKTYESIGRPLPGRLNIVLSRSNYYSPGVEVCASLHDAFTLLAQSHNSSEIMIIGGAQIYEQALIHAQRIYLTRIHHVFHADTFFPKLNLAKWREELITEYAQDADNQYSMTFYCYHRQ